MFLQISMNVSHHHAGIVFLVSMALIRTNVSANLGTQERIVGQVRIL